MAFKLKIGSDVLYGLSVFPEFLNSDTEEAVDLNENLAEDDYTLEENQPEVGYELEENPDGIRCAIGLNFKIQEEEEKEQLNNDNIIKNISFDQSEILYNIMKLYNGGNPFECDITASELKFYEGRGRGGKYDIPLPRLLFDVFPQDERVMKIEKWGALPLEDNSIDSVVVDLPFVISPANSPSAKNPNEGSQLIARRFAAYYPVDNLYYSYYHWIKECYRVLKEGGILVFKEQSVISGGIRHNTDEFSFMAGEKVGFKMIDKFILEAKARLISNAKYKNGQLHSRSYTSQFLVFKKEEKFKSKEFKYYELLDKCEEMEQDGYTKIVEK